MIETNLQPAENERVSNPETRIENKEIIENAQNDRLKIIGNVLKRIVKNEQIQRAASSLFNATIGSYLTLSLEAYRGKTTVGNQKLTPLGRIMDLVIVGTGVGTYASLAIAGPNPISGVTYAASWVGWGVMYGPDLVLPILEKAIKNTQEPNSKMSKTLSVMHNWIHKSKSLWFKTQKRPEESNE